jgi:O-antigen biosynthesis protein
MRQKQVENEKSNPLKIIIAGYYGFKNTGDELILSSMIQDLQDQSPSVSIVVISGNPKNTKKEHSVNAIAWSDIQTIINEIKSSNLVIIGGGGLFHDYWGFDTTTIFTSEHMGISFYSSIAMFATLLKIPLMLYAVGVGPLFSEEGKACVRYIAQQAAIITVRDIKSKEILINLGIKPERITVTADPVYALSPMLLNKHIPYIDLSGEPLLAISIRNWDFGVNSSDWEKEVASAIDSFLENHPTSKAIFVPFQELKEKLLDDFAISKRVQCLLKNSKRTSILKRTSSYFERVDVLSRCDIVLGMRLHSIICALKSCVPVVGIIYDPKIENILDQISNNNLAINISNCSGNVLSELLENTYQDREKLINIFSTNTIKLAKLAKSNAFYVFNLLNSQYKVPIPNQELLNFFSKTIITLSEKLSSEEMINKNQNRIITDLNNELILFQHSKDELRKELLTLQSDYSMLQEKYKDEFRKELFTLQSDYSALQENYNESINEIDKIKKSNGWKLLWSLWQIRTLLLPHGSRREKFLNYISKCISVISIQPLIFLRKYIKVLSKKLNFRMTLYSYKFRVFKANRQRNWPSDLSKLNIPCIPGLVSIILPVYNGEKFIGEAIDSILAQTYTDFELIVVNDGSTDNTGLIIDQYISKDNRIKVIHQDNQKLPISLNNGFKIAQGEYLTWTSDDNSLKPFYLSRMVSCLSRHPTWDMVYANMDIIGEDGTPLYNSTWFSGYQKPYLSEHIYLPSDTSELNIWPNNFIGGAFLYRRRVNSLLVGYSPAQYTREDYDYWMQINSLFTIKHVGFNTPCYDYRFHNFSLTNNDKELEITTNRKYLMVFDDFRRDFYLMPLIWIIDFDASIKNEEMYETIKQKLIDLGQIIMSVSESLTLNWPHFWIPRVYLKITDNPNSQFSNLDTLPTNCDKVLLISSNLINSEINNNWDKFLLLQTKGESLNIANFKLEYWASSDIGTLLTALDIYTRSKYLRQIEMEISKPSDERIKISVVICTYKRNQSLVKSLNAIINQTIPQTDYEILIVDNNPDPSELRPFIENIRNTSFQKNPDHFRLLHCPVLGLSYARNAGISEAKGEIILFLDDDSIAKKDILEHYIKAFSDHPNAGVIGGHIILERPANISIVWKNGWERYWSQFISAYSEYSNVSNWWEFPWGANWCARKKALYQIGGFRGKYGRRGDNFNGGEEIIAASLIQSLGYSVAILPHAEVIHKVDPTRFTLNHVKKTIISGILVHYQGQIDLHFPFEENLITSFSKYNLAIIKLFKNILHPVNINNRADFLETSYHLSARLKLLILQTKDNIYRIRFLFPIIRSHLK